MPATALKIRDLFCLSFSLLQVCKRPSLSLACTVIRDLKAFVNDAFFDRAAGCSGNRYAFMLNFGWIIVHARSRTDFVLLRGRRWQENEQVISCDAKRLCFFARQSQPAQFALAAQPLLLHSCMARGPFFPIVHRHFIAAIRERPKTCTSSPIATRNHIKIGIIFDNSIGKSKLGWFPARRPFHRVSKRRSYGVFWPYFIDSNLEDPFSKNYMHRDDCNRNNGSNSRPSCVPLFKCGNGGQPGRLLAVERNE